MTGNTPGWTWKKSPYSDKESCVEIGLGPDEGIAIRDSKNPAGPALAGSLQVTKMLHMVAAGRIG